MTQMIKGSMVALITPMDKAHAIDYAGLESLVEFHIKNGTDAIVAVGTTGESATLPTDEHIEVTKQIVKFVNGRVPVIGGNGANSTSEAIELTEKLAAVKVDAMLGVTPYYNKPTQDGLIAHFKTVAAKTDIPQILYNVPGRTAVDMLPETIAKLACIPNIIGVKEATGDLSRVNKLRSLCGDDFLLFSGDDATACDFLLLGGDGVISVVNNIAPKMFKDMCVAALNKDKVNALKLDAPLHGLYKSLFCEANPIPVKWAAWKMGLIKDGYIRLPLTELSPKFHGLVLDDMKLAKIEV